MPNILHVKRNFYQDDFSITKGILEVFWTRACKTLEPLSKLGFVAFRDSFELIFDLNLGGNIKRILPPQKFKSKISSKEAENRQNLISKEAYLIFFVVRSLASCYDESLNKWVFYEVFGSKNLSSIELRFCKRSCKPIF